jgi:F0F1-type ATP synthase assembly protein I
MHSSEKKHFKTFYALSLAWQMGFLVTAPIVGFLVIGFFVDEYLGTQPVALLGGLVIGLVVTVYEVYHLLAPLINDAEDD